MTTNITMSVWGDDADDPFDPAVVGALVGTEQFLHLGDATFPGTVTGVRVGDGGRYVHLSFDLPDMTFDLSILKSPPQPLIVRRSRFHRR